MKHYLLVGQYSTGIILHPDGKTIFQHKEENNIKYPYITVSSFEEAEKEALKIVINDPNLEVSVYDGNEEFIKTVHGNYIAPPVKKDSWWKFW
ncbi:MAG: hypothetical protein U5N85_08180 [Arcicella sp.]|nr:hypothetical protein [Arcicella sp.]